MKFPQMPYSRPNIEAMLAELKSLEAQLRDAADFGQADSAFLALDKLSGHAQTLIAIAQVRQQIDTNDAFYDGEVKFLDEQTPVFTEGLQAAVKALFDSPFRADFAAKYGELLVKNIQI
ncbi:MAG: M3 family oligoendopeptidase, partial [Clostridia bacterium]|nr:M3 family oligoendopeptidase [Clostridia bacterium]